MKGKILLGMLAALGCIALSTTRAEAGAGGKPTALQGFFVCETISGGNAVNQVFDLEVFGVRIPNVKIGNSNLGCVFAKLFQAGTETAVEPLPDSLAFLPNLKCYAIAASGQQGTPPRGTPLLFENEDAFGTEDQLQLSNTKYLCAPTNFTISVP